MCRRDDALYRSTVLPVVLKADQHSRDEKCVNWNEAAIRELLTIRVEAEIVRQFSKMVRGALYTSHEMSRVFTGSLRVVCERTHRFRKITGSVNEPKSDHPGTNHWTHFPCIFRNGCVKEAYVCPANSILLQDSQRNVCLDDGATMLPLQQYAEKYTP